MHAPLGWHDNHLTLLTFFCVQAPVAVEHQSGPQTYQQAPSAAASVVALNMHAAMSEQQMTASASTARAAAAAVPASGELTSSVIMLLLLPCYLLLHFLNLGLLLGPEAPIMAPSGVEDFSSFLLCSL